MILNVRKITCLLFILPLLQFAYAQGDDELEVIEPYLDSMELDFLMPVENELKFQKPRDNEFFEYDTRIKVKANEMEVLVVFHSDTLSKPFPTFFPHLEFNRLLGNIVPNDDDQDVLVIGWRDQKLKDKNVDWGAEAYIRPRKEITNFPFAKLIAFYREDQGMVVMLYCFRKPDNVPELIRFKEAKHQ
ncbi:hypothetical protein [Portibacter marinus]|uniref:hypothetical protein n=1 Tax=Portibacter marinus TaxID=2898660 RepID=UPI001F361137|nr:hypothetical protein [Portibacter marinus]